MVVVSVTVTDHNGNYVSGLKPNNFRLFEDGIPEHISSFGEGGRPLQTPAGTRAAASELDSSVFILFDTSNGMYGTFAYAEDVISDFIRGLAPADSLALYSFSRNLARDVPLTRDRRRLINGLRNTVAGDDTALFNSLLVTLRDAAEVPGKRVVVVFSNGPDNASMLSPDDVRRVRPKKASRSMSFPRKNMVALPKRSLNGSPPERAGKPTSPAAGKRKRRLFAPSKRIGALLHPGLLSSTQPEHRLPQN